MEELRIKCISRKVIHSFALKNRKVVECEHFEPLIVAFAAMKGLSCFVGYFEVKFYTGLYLIMIKQAPFFVGIDTFQEELRIMDTYKVTLMSMKFKIVAPTYRKSLKNMNQVSQS